MAKKISLILILSLSVLNVFAQNKGKNIIKFIKGNISDKTAAVREATEDEAAILSNKAIDFCLENKEVLGNDRELDGLAVAAVFSISPEYLKLFTDENKNQLSNKFIMLFNEFNSSNTVKIAILSKMLALKDTIPVTGFVKTLNEFIINSEINDVDSGVFKNVLNELSFIGNNETFLILYNLIEDKKYSNYTNEIKDTVSTLIPYSMNEILGIIHNGDANTLRTVSALTKKNTKIPTNYLCEISENVLSKSILLSGSSSKISEADTFVQLDALKILSDNKWTRAQATVLSYFENTKTRYESKISDESTFEIVISSLNNIAPIASVPKLISYLEELNGRTENGNKVSQKIVLAVIKTLGAIGDKSAFDSLLAVTYLNYDESVLAAAREALSGLRWQ
ncbi:HEAT repeat domain-containing protein [Treponema sp. Marseille-Q3903]|uniref:HEAT repeat domain-containing protein n=1 Tax=Treponema sp. Marseille-Q3903 TaxID=2766703 RepID=UPI001651C4C1|nr:HEAT repeat domain-containing protein [Treponema sp. Marseille-Q3903]MBC6713620.1 HEAT repeat domain-containing protein [Treponema sp. Marseille-Q3903]